MVLNPTDKPKVVLRWIQAQSPNPWPSCDTNKLGKLMRRIRLAELEHEQICGSNEQSARISTSSASKCKPLDLRKTVLYDELVPLITNGI